MDRLTTGIPGLDQVLAGGLPQGALIFLGGAPGTGKTLLGEQIAFTEAAAGRASLIVTALSEPHEKLIRHAEGFHWFDWARIGREVEFLSLYQTVLDAGLSGAMDLIVRTTHERQASTLIFDGFRGLRDLGGDELAIRRFIFELGGKLGLLGATTLLVGEYARDDVDRYPEFTIADGILMLRNDLVGVRHERSLEVVKLRGSDYLGGRHRFTISPAGLTVFPRQATLVADADYRLGAARLPIGVAGLDAMIGGGLRAHSVSLLLGTPGTGKTILALQFLAQGARQGERGVLVTFHESPAHLRDQAEALGVAEPELFANGSLEILYESPIELNADRVAARVRAAIAEGGVRRLAVDSLTNLEYELEPTTQSDYLIALTTYLRTQWVTTLLLKEIPELAGGPLTLAGMTVSVTVDNILLLRHVELDGQLERIVSVIKIRDSAFNARVHRYHIGGGGFAIGEPLAGVEGILIGLARLRSESAPPPARDPS
jgi:circadian clock protein KaiC